MPHACPCECVLSGGDFDLKGCMHNFLGPAVAPILKLNIWKLDPISSKLKDKSDYKHFYWVYYWDELGIIEMS